MPAGRLRAAKRRQRSSGRRTRYGKMPDCRAMATPDPQRDQDMNLHEYQAKRLFAAYGLSIPRGMPAFSEGEAREAAVDPRRRALGGQGPGPCRRARQGRRGGAGGQPGARAGGGAAPARQPPGHPPERARRAAGRRLLIEEAHAIARELYLSCPGGPRVASRSCSWPPPPAAWTSRRWPPTTPERILTARVHPAAGLQA